MDFNYLNSDGTAGGWMITSDRMDGLPPGSTIGSIPWGQSAHGSAVDWAAPADLIYRAETTRSGVTRYAGGGDGTSYSAAITTGAAALWLAHQGDKLAAAYPQPQISSKTWLSGDG